MDLIEVCARCGVTSPEPRFKERSSCSALGSVGRDVFHIELAELHRQLSAPVVAMRHDQCHDCPHPLTPIFDAEGATHWVHYGAGRTADGVWRIADAGHDANPKHPDATPMLVLVCGRCGQRVIVKDEHRDAWGWLHVDGAQYLDGEPHEVQAIRAEIYPPAARALRADPGLQPSSLDLVVRDVEPCAACAAEGHDVKAVQIGDGSDAWVHYQPRTAADRAISQAEPDGGWIGTRNIANLGHKATPVHDVVVHGTFVDDLPRPPCVGCKRKVPTTAFTVTLGFADSEHEPGGTVEVDVPVCAECRDVHRSTSTGYTDPIELDPTDLPGTLDKLEALYDRDRHVVGEFPAGLHVHNLGRVTEGVIIPRTCDCGARITLTALDGGRGVRVTHEDVTLDISHRPMCVGQSIELPADVIAFESPPPRDDLVDEAGNCSSCGRSMAQVPDDEAHELTIEFGCVVAPELSTRRTSRTIQLCGDCGEYAVHRPVSVLWGRP